MFERPKGGEKAVLVHLELEQESKREDLQEFIDLACSAGADPVDIVTGKRRQPEAKYFVGTGKAAEVADAVTAHGAELVLVNHSLSPAQERNLEGLLKCRVLDRIGLILDIFAQRARSHEGKLQVELAQLRHLSTRLIRGWTHLERQKGGIGLRGPGETQLESDRRLIGGRIKQLGRRLEKVRQQRELGRKSRRRALVPTVALVGYTNAGKSTLFNYLTTSDAYAADQLFATLDPTLRRLNLPQGGELVLADTVGFIRHLPHELVTAFHSTLEETRDADLLLHVIDASDEDRHAKKEQVVDVLHEIGGNDVPMVEIYNKIDALEESTPRVERNADGVMTRAFLSAQTGEGIELFVDALAERLLGESRFRTVTLPPHAGKFRARLYQMGVVVSEEADEFGSHQLKLAISDQQYELLQRQEGVDYLAVVE